LLSLVLDIECTSGDYNNYIRDYTGLYYTLYSYTHVMSGDTKKISEKDKINGLKAKLNEKEVKDTILSEFNSLDVSFYDCCLDEVITRKNQCLSNNINKDKDKIRLEKERVKLSEEEDKLGKKLNELTIKLHKTEDKKERIKLEKEISQMSLSRRMKKKRIYKINNSLAKIERNKGKNICFGGKAKQRLFTKLKQEIKYNYEFKNKKELSKERKEEKEEYLERVKKEFKEGRSLGVYFSGRACEGGNRKFDFDLNNNKIIFKPCAKGHFEIFFKELDKKEEKILKKIQNLIKDNLIPLTIRLFNDRVCISYDNELISGYAFNEKAYNEAIVGIKDPEEKKRIKAEFYKEQKERKLYNKIKNRYFAYDSNPNYIGICIVDMLTDDPEGDFEIVYVNVFELKELNAKLGLGSSDEAQLRQNNKRKYELKNTWCTIFKIIEHYNVGFFVKEDLSIKKGDKGKGAVFNRQTNNLWLRTESNKSINKFCQNLGIVIIEVNCVFSSVIGNINYNYFDPIASSLEIARRGIVKYLKGNSIYPSLKRMNHEKLVYLLGENVFEVNKDTYSICRKLSEVRVRNTDINAVKVNYLHTKKSKVKHFVFDYLG